MRIFKPISISLSPNTQKDDVFLAIKLFIKTTFRFTSPPLTPPLLTKERGIGGEVVMSTARLEQKFKQYLGAKYAFSANSGRSALFIILRALDIKEGDEVLLQAFTCNAVPNPVLWTGGTPIYVDIDDSLNISPGDLEKKITPKSRAVIIQNTFGVPAQIDKILQIAKKYNLVVIEDCAHALGAKYNGRLVGTFGDVAFFSFGRDKVISSVWGGMITTNNDVLAATITSFVTHPPHPLSYPKRGGGAKDALSAPPSLNVREGAGGESYDIPSKLWTLKQLLHPILFSIIIPTYYIFGKYLLAFLRIVRGVGLAVSAKERMGERPDMFPAKMPEALAELALHQFEKLEKYNAHRREIAKIYGAIIPGAIYLRLNILHPNAKAVTKSAKKHHILLGDWYKNIIDPIGTDFKKMKYTPGSCPNAEKAAQESINLPTHINISKRDAERIIQYLLDYR